MGMFWARPTCWAALDKKNVAVAETLGIQHKPTCGAEYVEWLSAVAAQCEGDFAKFSHEAHLKAVSEQESWLIAPGKGARFWLEWRNDGVATIGWDKAGDLRPYTSLHELVVAIEKEYPDEGSQAVGKMLWDFRERMQPGHIVFAKKGVSKVLGWGIVTSGYRFDASKKWHPHIRRVDWKNVPKVAAPDGSQLPQRCSHP